MFDTGEDIPINKQEAIKYYKMAADKRHRYEMYYWEIALENSDEVTSKPKSFKILSNGSLLRSSDCIYYKLQL